MKHLLTTFERRDVSTTSAAIVGSPLARRRNSRLKHLAFMLLFLLGSLNVWGEKITDYSNIVTGKTYYIGATTGNTDYYLSVNGSSTSTSIAGTAVTNKESATAFTFSGSGTSWTIQFESGNYLSLKNGKDNGKVQVVESASTFTASAQNNKMRLTIGSYSIQKNNSGTQFGSYANTQTDVWLEEVSSGPSQPTLSLEPTSKEFEATGNSAQTIGLTASNFASAVSSVTCAFFSEAECTTSITRPTWVNEPTVNAGKTQVSVNVADNDGSARQTWMKITASDGSKSASAVFAISQKKYTEPTGTFNKFTGELVEGDYILYYATNTSAMKNTVTSNRLDYSEVNPNDQDKFVNPDESIIWHLAKSGDNWTIYNAAVSKYAGGTTTKNQGALLDNTNIDLALWTCSSTSTSTTYDFLNVGRAGGSSDTGNKYLRNNKSCNPAVNYGFACYASGTGAALTLYKKALPTHAVTFTDAPAGGTVAVSAGSAINSGAQVEEGATVTITPTPSTYYRIASVTKGGQTVAPVQGVYSFEMPESDVAIVVTFELIPVTSVTLNKSALELVEGATETLSVTSVLPNTAQNTVTWSSSNTEVATVTNEGVVTAVKAGNATIKATSTVSTSVFGSCAVTVSAPSGKPVTISQTSGGIVEADQDVSDVSEGTSVTLTATPSAGYSVSGWTIEGVEEEDLTISQDKTTCSFEMPDGEVLAEASFTHEVAVLKLHDAAGITTYDEGNDHFWKESVTLPSTAAACSKTFMGWSANSECATTPEIEKGASYTLNDISQDLYAVYADEIPGESVTQTLTISDKTTASTYASNSFTDDKSATWSGFCNIPDATHFGLRNDNNKVSENCYLASPVFASNVKSVKAIIKNSSASDRSAYLCSNNTTYHPTSGDLGSASATGKGTSDYLEAEYTFTIANNASFNQFYLYTSAALQFNKIIVTYAGASTYSNYSTTCAAAAVATADHDNLNTVAAGENGTITMTYNNVNTANVSVALFNDAECTEAFSGEWLTALLNNDKNIEYSITENTSYNDARSAYIKLIAPETTGATDPAVVIIPVSQAKKPAVFANLAELAAADVAANTNVTVTLTNEVIKDIYLYNSNRRGLIFNIQKDEADIKIYFNSDVPAAWVAGGKVSGTLTDCPWKIYSNAWQLAPANGWQWEWTEEAQKGLVYTEPAEVSTVVVSGNTTKTTYVDGEKLNPAGLSIRVNYTDDTYEDNPVGVTFSEVVLHEGDTEANITATFGNVTSVAYNITGLTVNPIPNKTIAEFIAAGGTRCYLEGIVSDITNTKYGNFTLTDETSMLVYGCLTPTGESQKFAELGVSEGDKVKVIAETYDNTNRRAVDVVYVSKVSPVVITITDAGSLEVEKEHTLTISATTEPAAAVANITYSVKEGSEDYASVEDNVVTGLAKGTATIIASVPAGEGYLANSVEFEVNVVEYYSITYEENGGSEVADVENATALSDPLPTTTKENYTFNGWYTTSTFDAETEAVAGTTLTENVTLYAKWTEIPVWARTYTSNVTLVGGGNSHETNSSVSIAGETYTAKKVGSGDKTGTISITVPAGTNAVHFHGFAWNNASVTVSVAASPAVTNISASSFDLAGDAAGSGSGTYTINSNPVNHYNYFTFDAVEEATTFTFSKTGGSDNRFILYGVNAIYPEITLDPVSFDFGNVRANATKKQVFTITANDNVSGTLSAIITVDGDNNKYSVSAIEDNKVTVTFAPGDAAEGTFTAKLLVEASNASVTANLSGTAISAAAPMIVTDKSSIAFGRIEPNTEVSATVDVDLQNIDENGVSAALSGDDAAKFGLSATIFTEDGVLTITPNTSENGIFAATLTLSAEGAEDVVLPITMTVASKWAATYTSNVKNLSSDENKKVKVGADNTEYNLVKANKGSNATFKVPRGTQKIHVHMVAWSGEGQNVTISGPGCFASSKVETITDNENLSGASWSPLELEEAEAISYYYELTPDVIPSTETTITITAASGKRFAIFGVNQEGGIVEISDDTNASTLEDNANIEVKNGATLTVDADKQFGDLTAEAGSVIDLTGGGTITTTNFIIHATNTSSNQVIGATNGVSSNIQSENIYFEKDFVEAGHHWYNVAVPFNVDINGGIQTADGRELEWDTHFNFYYYDGANRALNGKGNNWIEETNQLQPGVNYQCVFDQAYGAIRFKKAAGANINNGANITANAYGIDTDPSNTNAGWNGIANNGLAYAQATLTGVTFIQVLNADGTAYEPQVLQGFVLIVGMPFFVQGAGTFSFLNPNDGNTPLYAPQRVNGTDGPIAVELKKNGKRVDRLYVTASEDAIPAYQIGKDVVKFTSNNAAQLWVNNYNEKLCANDAQLVNNQAVYDLGLYAPAAGTYSISAQQVEGATLYVTYNGAIVWNLSLGDYEMDLVRGTTTGYGLLLVAQPNQMPTGVENGELLNGENGVQKILLNGQLYILRDGHLYDAVGKEMK